MSQSKAAMRTEMVRLEAELFRAEQNNIRLLQILFDHQEACPTVDLPDFAGTFPERIWRMVQV